MPPTSSCLRGRVLPEPAPPARPLVPAPRVAAAVARSAGRTVGAVRGARGDRRRRGRRCRRARPAAGPAPVAARRSAAAAPRGPGRAVPGPAPSVLPAVGAGTPVPSAAGLRRVLGPLLRTSGLGRSVSAEIVDLAAGTSLFAVAPTRPAVPASSAKLLTGCRRPLAARPRRPPRHDRRRRREPRRDRPRRRGRRDARRRPRHRRAVRPGRAGMADLADRTAAALRAQGRTAVAVRLDDTLFAGSPVNPAWSPGTCAAVSSPR